MTYRQSRFRQMQGEDTKASPDHTAGCSLVEKTPGSRNRSWESGKKREKMKPLDWKPIMLVGAVTVLAGNGVAQPVIVTGTGDPNVDVPAVQAAVDSGGHVILTGRAVSKRLSQWAYSGRNPGWSTAGTSRKSIKSTLPADLKPLSQKHVKHMRLGQRYRGSGQSNITSRIPRPASVPNVRSFISSV
jgi:hypothetical protein